MFGGFKAKINFLGGKKNEQSELSPDMFVTGAYRVNRENIYGYRTQELPKLQPTEQPPSLRPVKSTSNLVQPVTANPNLRNSTPAISHDPRGADQANRNSVPSRAELKNQAKEQKKQEKLRAAEHKKLVQEKAKKEKLMREQAKKEAKARRNDAKKQVPTPQTRLPTQPQPHPQSRPEKQPQAGLRLESRPQTQPPPQAQPQSRPQAQRPQTSTGQQTPYSTNTIDSSISRSSGPPPYSEVPKTEPVQGKKDKTGNVVYSKPVDNGSWDIISQHREQISRPVATNNGNRKQMVMDLNYNFGATSSNTENSEA